MENISLVTKDNVTLAADFWKNDSVRAVVLVHQFNSSKKAYATLAARLNTNDFGVLALDLRGHGKSRANGNAKNVVSVKPKGLYI